MVTLASISCAPLVKADRFFGHLTYSYQQSRDNLGDTTRSGPDRWTSDSWTYETAILNYQDVLFTKNTLLFTANLARRGYPYTSNRDFRPIFFLDLRSYGYSISTSYSPYKRKVTDFSQKSEFSQFFRDWRTSVQTNFENWPTFGATYSHNRSYFDVPTAISDARSSNLILQGSYGTGVLTTQATFNSLSAHSDRTATQDNLTRTGSVTLGITKSSPEIGSLSTSYNFYSTRRWFGSRRDNDATTHSVSAFYASPSVYNFSGNASYSGRFYSTVQRGLKNNNRGEVFSGQLSYAPTGYLSFEAIKGYQINSDLGTNQITEYLALTSNLTRYLRHGVDTRLAVTRTLFQQSSRGQLLVGGIDTADSKGRYTLDTYYGSVAVGPFNYFRTFLDLSLNHDHNPPVPEQRYQFTRTIDARMNISRRAEGRLSYSSLYQGAVLRLDRSYSQNINAGLTYIPKANININLTYVYSTYRTTITTRNSSLSGYIGYSFRRAFSLWVNYNGQEQKQIVTDSAQQQRGVLVKPYTWNAQLFINLSSRTTVSLSYLYTSTPVIDRRTRIAGLFQSTLNIQI